MGFEMLKLKYHETRQNSNRAEEGGHVDSEETPLLHRFPPGDVPRSPFMMLAVSLLLTILVSGVIIGIYLLVLQSNSENILPPVETPLQLVPRTQWRTLAGAGAPRASPDTHSFRASRVIVLQTDTQTCFTTYSCALLLHSLQTNTSQALPYNFLVSSNGETFEAMGWHRPTPLFPQYPDTLILAFIGNFTEAFPSKLQIDEAKNFFAESVSQQYLTSNFTVFGKVLSNNNQTCIPTYLFDSLKNLPQWSNKLTDG